MECACYQKAETSSPNRKSRQNWNFEARCRIEKAARIEFSCLSQVELNCVQLGRPCLSVLLNRLQKCSTGSLIA